MLRKIQISERIYTAAPRWFIGMAAGLSFGLAAALLARASLPAIIVAILVFGTLGAVIGGWQKKQAIVKAPVRDKHIRSHVFQALDVTTKKLKNVIVDEQFNGVSGGGEKDRRSMKTSSPKLHIPPPTPKMGGY